MLSGQIVFDLRWFDCPHVIIDKDGNTMIDGRLHHDVAAIGIAMQKLARRLGKQIDVEGDCTMVKISPPGEVAS